MATVYFYEKPVKEGFAEVFFTRLETVAAYAEIKAIVLNHLEPDHTGALPELMRRAPHAQLYISQKAQSMLKALLKRDRLSFTPVTTGDRISLGDRSLEFLHTPYLHWPDTQCTYLPEEGTLFSGDVFGCHYGGRPFARPETARSAARHACQADTDR